ncbi:hypothetical protein HTZ84_09595 [Haloterrigena sp. SYSU A558-1]|uniref:Uncharacterized protein n=1 Tax=Haloterrigena gelatinilytica TaxID=2741724 RepID=A0ABX2LBL2_9EURY|nr:hypothetical protein [Haloterrigena gelatinilytica]NUC72559.1 hypothetical protein [Haloterrigena gelatinilytica]
MATQSVSGKTKMELAEIRKEFEASPRSNHYDFEDCYCLAKIPRQPEGYDGPARYCVKRHLDPDSKRCKFHGGVGHGNPESLDKYANLKHGMKATRKALLDTMTREGNEWQVELYEWVTEEWPEAYDVDTSTDPNAEYEFHALALEIIRAERAEGWIFKEGEKGQKRVFSPSGEMYFDDIPHYLADMMQRQRKLIMRMEDNLGISRKARLKADETNEAADLIKSFAEVGASLITKSDRAYDPDEFEGPPSDESDS